MDMTTADGTRQDRQDRPYAAIARESGAFAMVALDQRGSMEALFRDSGLEPDTRSVDDFRAATAAALIPEASAILLERGFLSRRHPEARWTGDCSLIVAADAFVQSPGGPLEASVLDPEAADLAVSLGASALKLLVLWEVGARNADQLAMVATFTALARERGLLSIVEGIVRANGQAGPPPAADLIEAAARLSVDADIYKAQVPISRGAGVADVEALSRELTAVVDCPWVVLSAGVPAERFHELVAASCRGGASGFLAGRAIWGRSLRAADHERHLRDEAVPGFRSLAAIVDAEARPWRDALATS
jgi:sulfofructosephosphate aldolase